MTRIKCCGMTRVEDALLAARLGVDAIGVVLTARSKRRVALDQAASIVAAMPASAAATLSKTAVLIGFNPRMSVTECTTITSFVPTSVPNRRCPDAIGVTITFGIPIGNPVIAREWFMVPLFVIDEAIGRIKDGTITDYVFDPKTASLTKPHG